MHVDWNCNQQFWTALVAVCVCACVVTHSKALFFCRVATQSYLNPLLRWNFQFQTSPSRSYISLFPLMSDLLERSGTIIKRCNGHCYASKPTPKHSFWATHSPMGVNKDGLQASRNSTVCFLLHWKQSQGTLHALANPNTVNVPPPPNTPDSSKHGIASRIASCKMKRVI